MSDQDSLVEGTLPAKNQIEIANRTYSEIRMEQIVNDQDFEYASIIEDEHHSRAKVIPADNQTVVCRNTIEVKRDSWWFSKKRKNPVTMRQIIDIRQKELLNDYAYETQQEGFIKNMSKYMHKIKVIEPDSAFYIFWQVINSLCVVIFFFQIPFMLAYQPLINGKTTDSLITHFEMYSLDVALGIFSIDMLLTFNIGYYKQGQLVSGRAQIAKHYLKFYFWFDLLPLICLIEYRVFLLNNKSHTPGLELLIFLMKMYEVLKTSDMIKEYLQLEPSLLAKYRLLTVMLTIIWLCHVFACIFFMAGRRELENNYNGLKASWLTESDVITLNIPLYGDPFYDDYSCLPIYSLHLYSFYWAVTTMISVGYGDVCPKNSMEVGVTVITQFISCMVFAYSINAIWEMINQQNENKQKFQKYVNAIERFMREHSVNRKLKARIEAYLFHLWQTEKARDYELEQAMIHKLAPALKEELIYETFGKMFNYNSFFSSFSQNLLMELAQDIQQVYYSQEEPVFIEGEEIDDFPIYFLVKGSVEIYLNCEKRIKLHILKQGIFGIVGFITGHRRTASARCLNYSVLYKLSRIDFLKRLDMFPMDKEKFFEIRHRFLFNNKYDTALLKCYICESKKHLAINCEKTLYIPQKWAIILQTYNVKNTRDGTFQRRVVKQYKALPHVKEVQYNATAIKKYFQNITFDNNSSDEDNEYSSDVDDYMEEMEDIKKMVEQEKQKAQMPKKGQWLAEEEYEIMIDQIEFPKDHNSVEFSADGDQPTPQLKKIQISKRKHSEAEEQKKKFKRPKQKHLSFASPAIQMRTASMSSLSQIKEHIKKQISANSKIDKGVSTLLPNNFVGQRKKSKLLQQNEIQNFQKSQQLPQSNEKVTSPDKLLLEQQKKSELLRKIKTLQIAQPRNQEIVSIIDELKCFIQGSQQGSIAKEASALKSEQQDVQEVPEYADRDSLFSVDQMANYDKFFQDDNPEKVIKIVRRQAKERLRQRRTTLLRQFDI